jgi:predicted extracellular nuclease
MKSKLILIILVVVALLAGCSRPEPPITGPTVTVVYAKINEIYSQGSGASPDWIEIYNPTSSSMSITGYKIYDLGGKTGSKPKKTLADTVLPANGLYVVICDTADATGLELSATGETIWLENGSGLVVDSIAFPALGKDTSYARQPDGSDTWAILTPVTKGTLNSILPLKMNEIYSRGVVNNADWIEIYNPSGAPVDLAGYKIYDVGGQSGTKPKREFPAGATVPANGFYVITTDSAYSVSDLSNFGLSSGGESVWLENPAGTIIDNVAFPAMGTTQTYGRIPDGGTWQLCNVLTPWLPNQP